MIKRLKRPISFLSAFAMVMAMLLYFPGETFRNIDWGLTASAAGTEPQATDEASVTINGETLYYATLEEAFTAANGKTATITMLNDAECSSSDGSPLRITDGNVTLDMNGKILSGAGLGSTGIISVDASTLLVQGPGTVKSTNRCLQTQNKNAVLEVDGITVDVTDASYGVANVSGTVTLDNVLITGKAKKYAVYHSSNGNTTINNVSATNTDSYCDVYYYMQGTLVINGGTFDKISVKSDNSGGITSVSQLLGEGCTYRHTDKTWATADELNALEIQNVTVEKIPLTINPQAETSWYYNSAEHSLQMNAVPTTENNEITYEWYDGDKKLECVSDAYTIPKTMSLGNYSYTCKATCDGYILSHEFTFTVEECKHENVEIDFNTNGFGNCPKCSEVVFQPAVETKGTYDINNDGTYEEVYEIGNAGQLYWFAALVNGDDKRVIKEAGEQNKKANAVLTKDITVNKGENTGDVANCNGNKAAGWIDWTPIGNSYDNQYTGTFDGQNHTISGLYFNNTGTDHVGLFGVVFGGKVSNVGVVDSYFKGNNYVGGVCGDNYGTIENCYNTGEVSGSYDVGGVCGDNYGTITKCYNTGEVSGNSYVGGVCGTNFVTITNCYNTGNVTATGETDSVGGVCGYNYAYSGTATITNCYNTGEVSGNYYVGGVCGENSSGTITNCYYDSTVYSGNAVDKNEVGTVSENVLGKITAQFTSGDVAYLLSQGCTIGEGESAVTFDGSVWGQDLSTADSYPVLDSTKKVYQNETYASCEGNPGEPTYSYSNTEEDPVYAAHTIGEDGICSICNQKLKYKVSLTSIVEGADADDTVAFLIGGGLYTIGTEATVIAQEKEGFTFKGWYNSEYWAEDKPRSEKLSYTFTPVEDTSLVAVYEANANITLNVNGERDGYYVNGEPQKLSSYTRSFKAGSYVYVGYSGSGTFCYWKNASGNIVSRDREYTFMLVSDTSLTAVAVGDSAGSEESGYSTLIEFVSCYGQVIQATTWNSKDEASGKTLPAAPSKFGGTFKYWSLDGTNEATAATILAAINGSTTRITVVPVYEEITTTYSITVKYPSDSNKDDVVYNNQKLGNTLTVTANSIEGKEFAYWSGDAEGSTKLSYSQSYFLLVSGDTTLYPIYSETVVEEQPVAAITNVSGNNADGKKKLCFEVTRSVPAKYELVEQGVIYSIANTYASDETAMVIGACGVYKFVSSDTANNGVFIANMNVTGHEDSKLYVKGYVILKNKETGNTETIYTDMAAKSYNDISQN